MPLLNLADEIICVIASYLNPKSWMHFTLTSKQIRQIIRPTRYALMERLSQSEAFEYRVASYRPTT